VFYWLNSKKGNKIPPNNLKKETKFPQIKFEKGSKIPPNKI